MSDVHDIDGPDQQQPKYRRGRFESTCLECGKKVLSYYSTQKKFCSRECVLVNRRRTGIGLRPRNGKTIKCPGCGEDFYISPAEIGRRVYCSHPCATKTQANSVTIPCATCGVEFSKAKSFGAKFCSRPCYLKNRVPLKECRTCGKRLRLGKLTFCSAECRVDSTRSGREKPCETCGVAIYVEPNQEAFKRYCSRACMAQGKKIKGIGFRRMRQDGYIEVYYPSHPDSTRKGVMLEHRLVAEQKYGRRILKTEHVHHINGIKDDNRPENLEVITPGAHALISNAKGVKKRRDMKAELAAYREKFGPLKQPF